MKPIVLVGHKHDCPRHGQGEVVSGNSATCVEGRAVACVGDRICCGAIIETGSPTHLIGGLSVARLGRLKLSGATLAGMGGFVLAWWHFADGAQRLAAADRAIEQDRESKSRTLAAAYFTRALATVTLSAAEMGTAIAVAKPIFDRLSKTAKNKFFRSFVVGMTTLSTRLGFQVARLILARVVFGAFWIGLAVTLIIWFLEDDALEKWCKRSTYRLDQSTNLYNAEKELPELFIAAKEVV